MGMKQDLETVMDCSNRLLSLLKYRQMTKVDIEENPDLEVSISPEIRQEWMAKAQALQSEIKSIVGGW